jgi:hypothetical protein
MPLDCKPVPMWHFIYTYGLWTNRMLCQKCLSYFNENEQSPVCSHPSLDRPDLPVGGPRIPREQYAVIEQAFRTQDKLALHRLMNHGNAAVRAYARELCDALDRIEAQPYGSPLNTQPWSWKESMPGASLPHGSKASELPVQVDEWDG